MKKCFQLFVAQRVITQLKKGIIPWRITPRPFWNFARNYKDDTVFTGINWVVLNLLAQYTSPYFLTQKQVVELGGTLKNNAKAEWVYNDSKNFYYPQMYQVFNSQHIKGIEFEPPTFPEDLEGDDCDCNVLLNRMNRHSNFKLLREAEEGATGDLGDTIDPPFRDWYDDYSCEVYHSLYTKAIHWTGHETRIGRWAIVQRVRPSSAAFAQEHLVAEFGTAYLSMEAGLNRAAYVHSTEDYIHEWVSRLRTDPEVLLRAANEAYAAIEYLFRPYR